MIAMQRLSGLFVAAVAAQAATRLWLASRQIDAVRANRERVPAPFAGQVTLVEQQRAADYAIARVRLGRWAALFEALIKLGDDHWRRARCVHRCARAAA